VRLGIVTNGTVRIQEPAIQRLGLSGIIDTVHISEREGVRKPDREIFERALRALDVNAGEAWYVGDHPDVDVRGAAAAGLTAIWRRTMHWPEPDASHRAIDRLDELLPWIPMPVRTLPN
jgi:putative hydrolase of the HAD superfamily